MPEKVKWQLARCWPPSGQRIVFVDVGPMAIFHPSYVCRLPAKRRLAARRLRVLAQPLKVKKWKDSSTS